MRVIYFVFKALLLLVFLGRTGSDNETENGERFNKIMSDGKCSNKEIKVNLKVTTKNTY